MDLDFKEYPEYYDLDNMPTDMDYMPKQMWAGEVDNYSRRLERPANVVIVGYALKNYTWTSSRESPGGRMGSKECRKEVQYIQSGDLFLGRPDVKYNFMICSDCMTYEGRGWMREPHLPDRYKSMTNRALYIGYVGDYRKDKAPEGMKKEADRMIVVGVKLGHIAPAFTQIDLANMWDAPKKHYKVYNHLSSIYDASIPFRERPNRLKPY